LGAWYSGMKYLSPRVAVPVNSIEIVMTREIPKWLAYMAKQLI